MSRRLPVAILRCDLGDPVTGQVVGGVATPAWPGPIAHQAVIGPRGERSVLAMWRHATFQYLDFSGSAVSPVLRVAVKDVVDAKASRDPDGSITTWRMTRRKMVAAASRAARSAGMDMRPFGAIVVVVRQGRLRHERRPVAPFQGGATTPDKGPAACIVPLTATHYTLAHEIGHALGLRGHSWGIERPGLDWLPAPFDVSAEYGDPFCAMSSTFPGLDASYLAGDPPSLRWPEQLYADVVPPPSLALVHWWHPEALERNHCILRVPYRRWHDGVLPTVRLYAASLLRRDRTKLVVLEGGGRPWDEEKLGRKDRLGTYYLEYRPAKRWDAVLRPDPAHARVACPAVVVHQFAHAYSCIPPRDTRGRPVEGYNESLPACGRGSGDGAREGRRRPEGPQVHFRARVPVPAPLNADWHAPGAPYVRVVDAASNGSWVDVMIGRPVATTFRELQALEPPEEAEGPRTWVRSGRQLVRMVCFPEGREFDYDLEWVESSLTLRAGVRGYTGSFGPVGNSPRITWTVQGTPIVAPAAGEPAVTDTLRPTVRVERYDGTAQPQFFDGVEVAVHYEVRSDGCLVLRNHPSDGNYELQVSVAAEDTRRRVLRRLEHRRPVAVRGHVIRWSEDYHTAVRACLDELMRRSGDRQPAPPALGMVPPTDP